MKFLKRAYGFMVGINAFLFLIVLIAPFGGFTLIIRTIRDGLYRKELFECFAGLFSLNVFARKLTCRRTNNMFEIKQVLLTSFSEGTITHTVSSCFLQSDSPMPGQNRSGQPPAAN